MQINKIHKSGIDKILILAFLLILIIFNACRNEGTKNNENNVQYLQDYVTPKHKYGLLNLENEVVYEPKFDEIRAFKNGATAINVLGKWGFLDTSLNIFIKPQYRAAWNFNEQGIARVQFLDGSYNYINRKNEKIFHDSFMYAYDYAGNIATAKVGVDSFVILYSDGTRSETIKAHDLYPTEYGYVLADRKGKEQLCARTGKPLPGITYNQISVMNDSLIRARKGMKYGVVTVKGKVVIPFRYYRLSDIKDGWITGVAENSVDIYKNLKLVKTLEEYQMVRYAGNDRFLYRKYVLWGILDTTFKEITAPIYKQLYNFKDGIAPFKRGDLWGYVNIEGIELTKPRYGLAYPYVNNYARVMFYEGMGIIDKYQKVIIPPAHRTYRDVSAGFIPYKGR